MFQAVCDFNEGASTTQDAVYSKLKSCLGAGGADDINDEELGRVVRSEADSLKLGLHGGQHMTAFHLAVVSKKVKMAAALLKLAPKFLHWTCQCPFYKGAA